MKIKYILNSNFPTEKAYGVTTENTIKSLTDLGHTVTLYCFKPNTLQFAKIQDVETVHFKLSKLNKSFRAMALKSFGKISIIAWNISWYLTIYENRKQLDIQKGDIIWTRDLPLLVYKQEWKHSVIIIEIHNSLSNRQLRIFKKRLTQETILCPISKSLENHIRKSLPGKNILWAPMGIEKTTCEKEELLEDIKKHYDRISDHIIIGYFGKLAPNGKSKGYEDLLDLGIELSRRKIQFRLKFVGALSAEIQLLEQAIMERKIDNLWIEIQPHVPHNLSLEFMKSCDFLLLPANRDLNYRGFPLKALEYVSALRVVVAANTMSNRDVFSEDFQPLWYEVGDINSLADLVSRKFSSEYLGSYLFAGLEFSSKYSWTNRTTRVLDEVKLIQRRFFKNPY